MWVKEHSQLDLFSTLKILSFVFEIKFSVTSLSWCSFERLRRSQRFQTLSRVATTTAILVQCSVVSARHGHGLREWDT